MLGIRLPLLERCARLELTLFLVLISLLLARLCMRLVALISWCCMLTLMLARESRHAAVSVRPLHDTEGRGLGCSSAGGCSCRACVQDRRMPSLWLMLPIFQSASIPLDPTVQG